MIILGLLLLLGTLGLSFALIQTNDVVYTTPVGTIELLGRHAELTAGQVFLGGATAGALVLLSLVMIFGGAGRRGRRRRAVSASPTTTAAPEREKELASR
jgi:hypothetical protein